MKKPFITIITSTYNCVSSLEKTILSVINQSSDSLEYIIIDGGSVDGTVDIIKKYSNYISYWISEKDNGIYDAWNKGILKSNGEFIAFLGSGDLLYSNYSKLFVNAILSNPEIDFVSSKMIIADDNQTRYGFPWEWNKFIKSMNVVHPGAIHNKNLFLKFGLYNDYYKIAGDYEFLLRIGKNLNTKFIREATVIFALDGVSSNNKFELAKEVRRAKIDNKVRSLFFNNFEFVIRVLTFVGSSVLKKSKFITLVNF